MHRSSAPALALLLAAAVLTGAGAKETSFTFVLKAGTEFCLYEEVPGGALMEMEFQACLREVVTGGHLDVDYSITDDNGRVLESGERKSDTLFEYERPPSDTVASIEFCFSNAFSTITDKEVFLLLAVDRDHDMPEMERSEFADDAESLFATLSAATVKIHKHLYTISTYQDHLRAREARHRHTVENNMHRVNTWSIIHLCAILLIGSLQVIAVRRFFKDPKKGHP